MVRKDSGRWCVLRKLYEKGVSIRQISRLTEETKGMVEKWKK